MINPDLEDLTTAIDYQFFLYRQAVDAGEISEASKILFAIAILIEKIPQASVEDNNQN